MLIICLHTKCHTSSFNGFLLIVIKSKVKNGFLAAPYCCFTFSKETH